MNFLSFKKKKKNSDMLFAVNLQTLQKKCGNSDLKWRLYHWKPYFNKFVQFVSIYIWLCIYLYFKARLILRMKTPKLLKVI